MDGILLILILLILSFIAGFFDAYIGIGYGVLMTPLLILLNFSIVEIVPAVLFAQIIIAIVTAISYYFVGNLTLSFTSEDTKIAAVLSLAGILGASIAITIFYTLFIVHLALLQIYIGFSLILIGILITLHIHSKFSWSRVITFGTIAAFNKGLSAGGYTPLVAGVQILTGRKTTQAIGVAMIAKAVTSTTAVALYLILGHLLFDPFFYLLVIPLTIGALLSGPIGSYIAKRTGTHRHIWLISAATITLGLLTIAKTLLSGI